MGAKRNLEYMSIWNSYLRWNLEGPIQLRHRVQQNSYSKYQQHKYKQHKYHDDNTGNDEEGLQG